MIPVVVVGLLPLHSVNPAVRVHCCYAVKRGTCRAIQKDCLNKETRKVPYRFLPFDLANSEEKVRKLGSVDSKGDSTDQYYHPRFASKKTSGITRNEKSRG